jgi:signal transduction histidine kinase
MVMAAVRDVTERTLIQQRLKAVHDVTAAILADAPTDTVLGQLAGAARRVFAADAATVALPTDDLTLRVVTAEGEGAGAIRSLTFPIEGSVSGRVLRTGVGELVDEASEAPDAAVALPGFGAALVVPLAARGETFGTLALYRLAGRPSFQVEDLHQSDDFAAQAAVAIEYARAQQDRRRVAVLDERERLARDLHDTVIQRLFAIGLSIQGATSRAREHPELVARLSAAVDEIDETIREIRTAIFSLSGGGAGLRFEVLEVVRQAETALGSRVRVRFSGAIDAGVPEQVATHVVAVVREALSNAVRHAHAQAVQVSLAVDDEVVVRVEDDGVGLPARLERRSGLRNLAERAGALGGSCSAGARPQGGTLVEWRVPLRAPG